jgi:protein gp37
MSDLFHVKVPWEFIIKVFDVMAATPWHTYQVLTKRPGRMAHFAEHIWEPYTMEQNHSSHIWPRNVWAGTSVEMEWDGNKHLAKRLDCLARVPAQVSFLSAEPLLGPLDLRGWLPGWCQAGSTFENPRKTERWDIDGSPVNPLSWVIVGGESGPGARPMHPDWARSLRDQCQAARVPFFFKQWGEWMPAGERLAAEWLEDGVKSPLGWLWENGEWCYFGDGTRLDSKAGSPSLIHKTGKKAAGAVLDGREWREMPPERRE